MSSSGLKAARPVKKRRILRTALASGLGLLAIVLVILSLTVGCMFFTPLPSPSTVGERVAVFPTEGLPIEGRVTVYWDEHMIPFIEAERDDDVAFVLGMVHAHLRLGQMEMIKRVARARLA